MLKGSYSIITESLTHSEWCATNRYSLPQTQVHRPTKICKCSVSVGVVVPFIYLSNFIVGTVRVKVEDTFLSREFICSYLFTTIIMSLELSGMCVRFHQQESVYFQYCNIIIEF